MTDEDEDEIVCLCLKSSGASCMLYGTENGNIYLKYLTKKERKQILMIEVGDEAIVKMKAFPDFLFCAAGQYVYRYCLTGENFKPKRYKTICSNIDVEITDFAVDEFLDLLILCDDAGFVCIFDIKEQLCLYSLNTELELGISCLNVIESSPLEIVVGGFNSKLLLLTLEEDFVVNESLQINPLETGSVAVNPPFINCLVFDETSKMLILGLGDGSVCCVDTVEFAVFKRFSLVGTAICSMSLLEGSTGNTLAIGSNCRKLKILKFGKKETKFEEIKTVKTKEKINDVLIFEDKDGIGAVVAVLSLDLKEFVISKYF